MSSFHIGSESNRNLYFGRISDIIDRVGQSEKIINGSNIISIIQIVEHVSIKFLDMCHVDC